MFNFRRKLKNFINHIELLNKRSSNRVIDGFDDTEKELVKKFILDTRDFVEHNEWGVGLEILLSNIYEIDFTLDQKAVDLAKEAIQESGLDYSDWICIEELVK